MSGWIGVDLDGTLAEYGGWQGPLHIGAPVSAMLARVKDWLAEGLEVRIFTARVAHDDSGGCQHEIERWCEEHETGGRRDRVGRYDAGRGDQGQQPKLPRRVRHGR